MNKYTERNGLHYSVSISHNASKKRYEMMIHPARPTSRDSYEVEIFCFKVATLNSAPRKSAKSLQEAEKVAETLLDELMNQIDKERTLK